MHSTRCSSTSIGPSDAANEALSRASDGALPVQIVESLGVIGHELRNALSCITSATAVMQTPPPASEKERRRLAIIDRAARRMARIVSTTLEYARVASGAVAVHAQSMDLRAVCEEIIEETLATHSVAIRLAPGDAEWGCWDPVAIAQVLSNLLLNAAVHGVANEPIDVEIRSASLFVAVTVTNRGPAIPRESLAAIFEPFRRGPSAGRTARGLGLGLYVVHRLVAAHSGTVTVESSAERGTSFTMELPRRALIPREGTT